MEKQGTSEMKKCRSELISMEPLTEKHASRLSSVRFSCGDPDSEPPCEEDCCVEENIKSKICSCLPSNTLGRRKLRSLSTSKSRASTFPRSSVTDRGQTAAVQRNKSFLDSLKKYSAENRNLADEIDSCLTEDEKLHELANIKNIPVRLQDKHKYKSAILHSVSLEKSSKKSRSFKCFNAGSFFKHLFSCFELWSGTLKHIEGEHGTGVVSYFVFLRWLILLNSLLFLISVCAITLPHEVFPLLPKGDLKTVPNTTILTDEFINKFPKESKSGDMGSLLEQFLPEEGLDWIISYGRRNWTSSERHLTSELCYSRYREQLSSKPTFMEAVQDAVQGTGWLESTVLFLGYYSPQDVSFFGSRYNMPLATISTFFVSFLICVFMMLHYSSRGVRESVVGRRSGYLSYSNLLFCSWDYCIQNKKSSLLRHTSIRNEIKSTLLEERRRLLVSQWSQSKKLRIYSLRVVVNILVLLSIGSCYYLIFKAVVYQLKESQLRRLGGVKTLLVQYLSPVVITVLNVIVPIVFNALGRLEIYTTRTHINVALFRTVFVRLSSVFALVGMLYQQITCEPKDQCRAGITAACRSPLCWETYVGQQLYKLAVTDFIVYMVMFLAYDLPRDLIVRHLDNKMTRMIGRQVFDLPNQVLALVYSQTLCWLGIIYSPLLPFITVLKFIILFYVKKLLVLKYCSAAPVTYRASRSNAMFMMILMLSFFTLLLIHGFALTTLQPSPACGPFRYFYIMVDALPEALFGHAPSLTFAIHFLFSGLFLCPLVIILSIAIYYYWSVVLGQRKMLKVLEAQIVLEGRDKQFLLNRLTQLAKGELNR